MAGKILPTPSFAVRCGVSRDQDVIVPLTPRSDVLIHVATEDVQRHVAAAHDGVVERLEVEPRA